MHYTSAHSLAQCLLTQHNSKVTYWVKGGQLTNHMTGGEVKEGERHVQRIFIKKALENMEMWEHSFTKLTSHTDSEVVTKHLSDVSDKICSIGETIRDWLPLLTIWGV